MRGVGIEQEFGVVARWVHKKEMPRTWAVISGKYVQEIGWVVGFYMPSTQQALWRVL